MKVSAIFKKAPKALRYLFKKGIRATIYKLKHMELTAEQKQAILHSMSRTEKELAEQRETVFSRKIKISILVPLYNTPIDFLKDMIDSVVKQTYSNWELCLADGSNADHPEVKAVATEYAKKDPRILYQKLEKNLGISENTNACIDMATGDYIALFDHDDLLHQSVLFEVMQAICNEGADFVFTDEIIFASPDPTDLIVAHYKQDYAPDTLHANNYICHFSVFSRALLNNVGRFRKEFDGSQDHDMILRLTEQASKIVHIPKLLYLWRSHPLSVAQSIGAKDYAVKAGMNAVRESTKRLGVDGAEVGLTWHGKPVYRVQYPINTKSKVSVIISHRGDLTNLKKCIRSICKKTTYPHYEIVIDGSRITDPAALAYLQKQQSPSHIVATATGEYLLFLDSRVTVMTPDWIEQMLMFAQRGNVGAVGSKLYYPDKTIAHAGIILGMGEDKIAGYLLHGLPKNFESYLSRQGFVQNFSAVSSACMMVRAEVYQELNGFDGSFGSSLLREVDFCLKARQAGYLMVWTPYAEAYYHAPKCSADKNEHEIERFKARWKEVLDQRDPYYNPNFSLEYSDYYPDPKQ